MVADFLTKPLQGSIFMKFRDSVMGHSGHDLSFVDGSEKSSAKFKVPQCHTSKERVENPVPDQ